MKTRIYRNKFGQVFKIRIDSQGNELGGTRIGGPLLSPNEGDAQRMSEYEIKHRTRMIPQPKGLTTL